MKKTSLLWLWALTVVLMAGPPAASDADADREAILAHLARTSQLFLDSLEGLSESQMSYKPAADRWSIAEIAEHVTVSETFIRSTIAKILEEPTKAGEGARHARRRSPSPDRLPTRGG